MNGGGARDGLEKNVLMDILFDCIGSGDLSSVRAVAYLLLRKYPGDAETLFFAGMFSFGNSSREGMAFWKELASSMGNLDRPEAERILDLIYPQMVSVISGFCAQEDFESYSELMSMGRDLAPYGRMLVRDVIAAVPAGVRGLSAVRFTQTALGIRKLATSALFCMFPGNSLPILEAASDSLSRLAYAVGMLGGGDGFSASVFRACSGFLSAEWDSIVRTVGEAECLGWDSLPAFWQGQSFSEFSGTVEALEKLFPEYCMLTLLFPDEAEKYLDLRMRECFDLLPFPGDRCSAAHSESGAEGAI